MCKHIFVILTLLAVLVAGMAVSGCTTAGTPTATPTEKPTATVMPTAVLSVTGNVNKSLSLTMDDLRGYPSKSVNASWNATNKGLITVNATGALLNSVLDAAGPKGDATNVVFRSADDASKTVLLSNVRASQDAIIGFMDNGTLRDVIPGQPAGTWMSNLVTIEVQ